MKLRWRLTWLATYPLAKMFLNLRVRGRDRLPPGPLVLAANHTSHIDPIVVGWAAARELHFMAKEELFNGPRLFGWLVRFYNAWPVKRTSIDPAAIKRFSYLLRRRQTVVLFPEGTRSKTGEMAGFKPGIGMLAIGSRAPVVPTLISGLDRTWLSYLADRDFVRRGLRKKPRGAAAVTVVFGEPVRPDGFERSKTGYLEMTRAVEEEVRRLKTEGRTRAVSDARCEMSDE